MTDTFDRVASEAEQARDEALTRLAALGNEVEAAEEALTAARHRRLEYAVTVAESKLVPIEHVWVAARMARTTLYNELQLQRGAGIKTGSGMAEANRVRDADIVRLYGEGYSATKIAKQFDLSHQRVAQILAREGVS